MEPTTPPPFMAPPQPAHPALPKRSMSPIVAGILWAGAVILWLGAVAFGWFVAFLYASDTWGGGWLYGSGVKEPFYDEVILAINVTAFLLATVPFATIVVWRYRKASR